MSTNLLELAKGYLSNAAVGQVSEFLGEDPSRISKGLSGTLPIILGGIMKRSSTEDGLGSLTGLINLGSNSGILDNLSGLLSNKSLSQGLLDNGSGLVLSTLGNNVDSVVDEISSFSGLNKSSSRSLLSIVAPLLMSVIGKQVKLEGLSLSGLASLLMEQKGHVQAAIPAGLSGVEDLLNFDNLGHYKGKTSLAMAALSTRIFRGRSWMNFLLPILLIMVAIWAYTNY
ncbi:DUF937 domain-containing protein [Arcticibacterium luteifluviistationis]|uniref:DUF937 domain-containing protein n=1 Tax=Arcticibacterium luteifluviistationis TaxID=1784714 RepID=A0A2Z4GD73_9BACT|nr:DUF937 domain-containing protein [Arcticibacterium luteifluviistationis]AWV99050.1 hypothetical protein DJ013_13095 [Arcticibacterium luteifluviistationis]